jgi:co-chaperonin GroES (HSP10)
MLLSKIELKPNKILIQPSTEATSSFSTEQKKYERKAVAIVKGVSNYVSQIKEGDKVIYDDSKSIDFTLDGISLSIISPEDIVAYIKEDK